MEFRQNRPIYLQIADLIADDILNGKWQPGARIPSVRELSVSVEVNPNTAMRAYAYLQDQGIIVNRRGIGYFAAQGAVQRGPAALRGDTIVRPPAASPTARR